jgi:Heterokaryon incompatibility protein (HET)
LGSTADLKAITLSGRPWEVTQNLFSALQHLRLPNRDGILWVDALCINQADDDEKSRQVGQMRRVYAGSNCTEKVLVWLGDGPEGKAKMALDFMVKVEQQDQEAVRIRTRVGTLVPGRSTEELCQKFWQLSEKLAEIANHPITWKVILQEPLRLGWKLLFGMSREDMIATLDDPIDKILYENYDSTI